MRMIWFCALLLWTVAAPAAERVFNLSEYPLDERPPGFRSTVAGLGKPGEWKVMLDDVPPEMVVPGSRASSVTKRAVLGQLARDPVANHFPLLIYEKESYGDLKLATRFKIVGGAAEQIAGVVFHFQNESNYFVAAANSLRSNLCCYRVLEGTITPLFGQKLSISAGEWHTLGVQCEGNRVVCAVDDKEPMKLLVDSSAAGRIGFWTKSDSVAYFADTRIEYTAREILAQVLVREAMDEYSRVLDLKIFAVRPGSTEPTLVASKDEKDLGQAGGKVEADVISQGMAYFSRDKKTVTLTAPLLDRNGDPIAAVRVVLKAVAGQSQDIAVARAQPIVRQMQLRVQSLQDLLR